MKYGLFIPVILAMVLISCNNTSPKAFQETSKESSAADFIIKRGLNVSHWLSQTEIRGQEREDYVGAEDFAKIASMGFDHVRIPFDEMHMWDEEGKRQEDAFALLHIAVEWAIENNLRVIIDLHVLRSHHFNTGNQRLWTDPLAQEGFWGFWKELSAEFSKYPVDMLAYELMNEAVAENPDDWNKLIGRGIATVRENEPERVIVVGSNKWQQVHTFDDLKVPEGDENIILSFHYYDPFILTHYQAPWTGTLQYYTGPVHYPGVTVDSADLAILSDSLAERLSWNNGNWNPERIEADFMKAKKVADSYGLQLFCGEFGCFPSTPMELREAYYRDIVAVFDKLDIAWTHWNYKNDFPVVDENTLEPIEEILSALVQEN